MKKTLVAVAALAAIGAAQAQSSVKIGGVLDGGVSSYSNTGATHKSLTSFVGGGLDAPSNFNLSGSEDLGGGMKANFMLESGISTANGGFANSTGALFGRMAFVGLSGGFGSVNLGLQFDPAFVATLETDPNGATEYAAGVSQWLNTATSNAQGTSVAGIFDQNAVSYSTPSMGGFGATVLMTLGGVAGKSTANSHTSVGLKYSGVPGLLVTAGGYQSKNATGGTGNESSFGASYKFGQATLAANYLETKTSGSLAANKRTATNFGGGYEITSAASVTAGYYDVENKTTNGSLKTVSVIGHYALSKTTKLYLGGQNAKNSGFGGAALDAGGVGSNVSTSAANAITSTGVVFGMTKAF